ncbi:MAG: carboxylesterase family protein [Treponemataceae bacterium]|nr:carboxylesterase family protein [Spirochaetales bacterium]MDY6032070.1 carboxylesterase family protein [Treponemataceae bacterium]
MEQITLKTKIGSFKGLSNEKSYSFLGIKYADSKRFERATLKTDYSENEIYDATKYGPCCPQMRTYIPEDPNSMYYREFRENLEFTYSEDCLFLNIFMPKDKKDEIEINCSSKKYPVLIYIHGGSFTRGSSAERPFDGSNLSSRGIIVVTINYRLNIFGTYMGKNLMLYDMKTAIEWVYKNISEFGGDSQNITLSAQSAGAMSCQQLIFDADVKKYVRRAIMLSGGAMLKGIFAPKSKFWAKSFYKSVEKDLRKRGLDALQSTSQQLFESFHQVCKKRPINAAILSVFPTFDGEIVKKSNIKNAFKNAQMDCFFSVTKDDLQPRFYLEKSAKKYSKKSKKIGNKVYLNYFNRGLPPEGKAFHSSDLWYFFGNLMMHTWRKFEERDYEISNEIMTRVVLFCNDGNINPEGFFEMKPYEFYELK